MKQILVPTDFSPTAEKAFRFALKIAEKAKAGVILYHNYIPVESTFIGTDTTRKQHNLQTEASIVKRMQELKTKVTGGDSDVAISTIVGRSPLIDNMLGFAGKTHMDLVVMGSQGASGLKKTILGSVAARVIEKSCIPVLLIPEKYEWKQPRQIIFATDYLETDKQALSLVDVIASWYDAEIMVLHLVSVYTAASDEEKEKSDFDKYVHSMQSTLNELKIKFQLLQTSSVIETMETLDNHFHYDIMAMVRRKKTFLERFLVKSFTQDMAYVTTKPLLIVPEESRL